MKIKSAEYIISVASLKQCPTDDLPQIAFAGRSNVGKSSLLNSLLNRKKLALVSSTPGKTRTINFFLINGGFYFVDLPGYGYAKVSKTKHSQWRRLVEDYLTHTPALKGVAVLTDLRHDITPLDFELLDWLTAFDLNTVVIGTKADKLSGNRRKTLLRKNAAALQGVGGGVLLPYSSVTGYGKPELWQALNGLLKS
jgi:GTP-binding protein